MFKVKNSIFTIALLLLTALPANSQVKVSGEWNDRDTVNVEHFDDSRLKPLIGSLSTVPFFNAEGTGFWYSWQEAGQQDRLKTFVLGQGTDTISNERTREFEGRSYPRIIPYGTSPDSLFRLSTDSAGNLSWRISPPVLVVSSRPMELPSTAGTSTTRILS